MKNSSIINRTYNTRSAKREVQDSRSQRNSKFDTRSKGKNSALSKHQEWSSSKDSDKQSEEVVSDYEDELTQEESEDSVDGNVASERTSRKLSPIRNRSHTSEPEDSAESSHIQQHIPVQSVQPPQTERTNSDNLEDSSARQSENSKARQRSTDWHILRQSKVTMTPEDYSSYLRDVSNSSR
ncbi:hypothetical protein MKW98_024343 [Papaver atlanticum]|uniref:Uncharacterized protein n=1 Tax=Papaver atlanticum TaxID=357466 RepID=A0AAD4T0K2_9MAGN|nr:hypothetical protein MKW98_024343 [Papaver atlanticum]